MNFVKVSVIVPTYNEAKVILECLESLGRQTFDDFEIIVVDDGSTDDTAKILSNLKKEIPNFSFFKVSHKGAGVARNLGAKNAKGDILVFVDADMTFDKDFIKKLVSPILNGKSIGTFSKDEYLENKNNIWAKCWNVNRGLPKDRMHGSNYPNTQKVFRAILKKEFEKVGGFNEELGYIDDWSLSQKLGVEATNARGAVFYHKNPDTLSEVFSQSRWMAKRNYKAGALGYLFTLIKVSLPISIIIGIYKSILYSVPTFLVFKIVSDLGSFVGILEYTLFHKVSK